MGSRGAAGAGILAAVAGVDDDDPVRRADQRRADRNVAA